MIRLLDDDSFEEKIKLHSTNATCVPIYGGKLLDLRTLVTRDRTPEDLWDFELERKFILDEKKAEEFKLRLKAI